MTENHKRRPRYKGTHPRRFQEKYKELDPARFSEEQEKVRLRGQTPAGTHCSIMVAEILRVLDPKPGDKVLDATLGYGGHSLEILASLAPGGHLTGLDVDPLELPRTEQRIRQAGFDESLFTPKRMNFGGLAALIGETGGFDCILADLGLSSMQIDNPERGFTYKADGPLDLRLNPMRGKPAFELLASLSKDSLAELLHENSDEPFAPGIAAALKSAETPIRSTRAMAETIRRFMQDEGFERQDPEVRKSLQRCFQALRIAVNDEFTVLEQFLTYLPKALNPGGRVAILTFHSGEDRRVKKAFQEGFQAGIYKEICDSPERPSPEERHLNPRSGPAKLRWAVRFSR